MSMEKWQELAVNKLGSNDQIEGTWPGQYNGKFGHIVLSQKRLLFITEKGLFNKTAELTLDKGYDQFNGNEAKNGQLELTDIKGEKYILATSFLPQIRSIFEKQRKH
jgi:hypothetical protein